MDAVSSARGDAVASPEVTSESAGFEAVYAAHAAGVYRFCLSIIGDPTRAEDAAAQTMAAAYVRWLRSAPPPDCIRPWLFRIARNAAIDEQRRGSRWHRLVARATARVASAPDLEAEVVMRDDLRAVVRAVAELGERDRIIVSLRAAAGLEHADIGMVLGISENAAKVAAHRAFRRLREGMEDRR
jgi:RNA polymerase sigma-70 factor (ECF subfamily)